MSGFAVLDVFLGLLFIYLLYSLLATTINELIASIFGLRARVLSKAVDKLLVETGNNEFSLQSIYLSVKRSVLYIYDRFLRFFGKRKERIDNTEVTLTDVIYNHPLVKKLGKSKLFRKPEYMQAKTFSAALIDILKQEGVGINTFQKIDHALSSKKIGKYEIDEQIRKYLKNLFEENKGDLIKFQTDIETWYDSTMVSVTSWYKRLSQKYIFILGLIIAISFNVDTISIVKMLSKDEKARQQLVDLAIAYQENSNGTTSINTSSALVDTVKVDSAIVEKDSSYLVFEEKLEALDSLLNNDIHNAKSLLGIGWVIPDSLNDPAVFDPIKHNKTEYETCITCYKKTKQGKSRFWFKVRFFFCVLFSPYKFFGLLLTALAITLGAPFWFDLLNKFILLRSSLKPPEKKKEDAKKQTT